MNILLFFDFYPIITASDSFGELFIVATEWILWNKNAMVGLFLFLLLSKIITAVFHRKIIALNMIITPALLLIFNILEFIIKHPELNPKSHKSNTLLYTTISIMTIIIITLFLFFIASYFFNKRNPENKLVKFGKNFQSLSLSEQSIMLNLVFISFFSYRLSLYCSISKYCVWVISNLENTKH